MSGKLILSEIWVYPIKSLPGIRVKNTRVMEKGLEYDRRLMLIDTTNNFLTQRLLPIMSQFDISLEKKVLMVRKKGETPGTEIIINLQGNPLGQKIKATIWQDQVEVYELDSKFSHWFSKKLNIACKLVQFPEASIRLVDGDYSIHNENVSLSDGYPYLITGQSSLDDLNQKLEKPISIDRFRPNFVFTGGKPYGEDHWKNFSIGKNKFTGVKLCSRCVLTTVNPSTGIRETEPLRTLSTFRKKNDKVYFGLNAIATHYEQIYQGDEIILE